MDYYLFRLPVGFLLIWMLSGCLGESASSTYEASSPVDPLFVNMPPAETSISFANNVEESAEFNVLTYRNFYNGGGVAIGDVNGDDIPDIYFTANNGPNHLYLNEGNWKFREVGELSGTRGSRGWSTGVSMVDINADGWLDIYVCNSGDLEGDNKRNELFVNQGLNEEGTHPVFKEMAAAYGLDDGGFSTHASFFDYDRDGDLDCYLLNNSFKDPSRIDLYRKTREEVDELGGDKLFRNDGGSFVEVTREAGIYSSAIGFGLGVSVSDLNNDGWPDIYISNDFWERDYLYINQQDGTFLEDLTNRIGHTSISSMGSDIGDINQDGAPEIFSTDMLAGDNYRLKAMTAFDPYHLEDRKYRANYHYQILQNCLQLNNGSADFQEIGFQAGVASTDWSWGALMLDFDLDGQQDIFVANGIYRDIMYLDFTNFLSDKAKVGEIVTEKGRFDFRDFLPYLPSNPLPNYAFLNDGELQFRDAARELGLGEASFSNGAAYGDLDMDGDLDLVVNNVNMPAFLYQNQSVQRGQHFLYLSFDGSEKNPLGIGAKVKVRHGDQTQFHQHYMARGFQSSMGPGIQIGLGDDQAVQELSVEWPDGKIQLIQNPPVDTRLTLKYGEAKTGVFPPKGTSAPLFVRTDIFSEVPVHQENTFNDFDHERLLPHMLSTEGPRLLQADVTGNGHPELLMLGAMGQPDQILEMDAKGRYMSMNQPAFLDGAEQESTCGLFFDPDGDGDLDLIVGAGGNELQRGIEAYLLRYFENDGKGNFRLAPEHTPPAGGQVSCIRAGDMDGDGDADLFIGGRAVPGNYGLPPRSFLFRNDGGSWTQVTPDMMAGIGMVTDAAFADVNGDQALDLVIVGEWMPVTVFLNEGGAFNKPYAVKNSTGWWNRMEAKDLDGDGDMDFVLGNWGHNMKLKASPDRPLELFVKDYDANKKSDFLLNWYPPLDDISYPFAGKLDLHAQLPHLKKRMVEFEDYAHLTYETLLNEEEREGALHYTAETMSTSVLWHENGGLTLVPLPEAAQMAPVFGICVEDLDQDGLQDLILGGNFFGLKPEVGRFDAQKGMVLMGKPGRKFHSLSSQESGFWWEGEVRDLVWIEKSNTLLVARNNDDTQAYSLQVQKEVAQTIPQK